MSAANAMTEQNQRRTVRKRSLLSGKLAYHQGRFTLSCTIRDISEGGARIKVPTSQILPTTVFLVDVRESCAYEASTKWQSKTEAGLEFVQKIKLDVNCPEEYRYLRRILIEALPR